MSRPAKQIAKPVVTENGERVIPGTMRPDGTMRKERRVRDGYVPQEEQQVYQSRGVVARQGIPVCPGLDDTDLAMASKQAMTKAQKKNEKRKEKKTEPGTDSASMSSAGGPAVPPAAPPAKIPGTKAAAITTPPSAIDAPGTVSNAASVADAAQDTPAQQAEKQLRALRKKLRQAQGLSEQEKAGRQLTQEEQDKLARVAAWDAEVHELEARLQSLTAGC